MNLIKNRLNLSVRTLLTALTFIPVVAFSSVERPENKKVIDELNYALRLCSVHIDSAETFLDSVYQTYRQQKDTFAQVRLLSLKSFVLCFDSRYEEGLISAYKALDLQNLYGRDSLSYGIIYLNMSLSLDGFGRTEEAIEKTKLALANFEKFGDEALIDKALNNLGAFLSNSGKKEDRIKAVPYYRRSAEIRIKKENYYMVAYSYFNMAGVFFDVGQLDSFDKYILLSRTTFKDKAGKELPAMVKYLLAEHYTLKGKNDTALGLLNEGIAQSVKIGNTEMEVIGLKQLSDTYGRLGEYKKAYKSVLKYDSIKLSLDSINSAERIARYEERSEKAEATARFEKANAQRITAESNTRRVKWMLALSVLITILIAAGGYLIFIRRQRKAQMERAQLQTELEQTKLLALRSQMNPHFIFNSIHLAQSYILTADKAKAYEHLEKFAKLLRLTLDNSTQMYIPLEDEIKQLEYYLALEHNRFENKFSYHIQVDDALKQSMYEIPGMLIQPFVENALIHGVINIDDNNGEILVELRKDGNQLKCSVRDNGVGRVAAQEIKDKKDRKYRSVATFNIDNRIDLLCRLLGDKIQYRITDLHDTEGNSAGTLVDITIPLM